MEVVVGNEDPVIKTTSAIQCSCWTTRGWWLVKRKRGSWQYFELGWFDKVTWKYECCRIHEHLQGRPNSVSNCSFQASKNRLLQTVDWKYIGINWHRPWEALWQDCTYSEEKRDLSKGLANRTKHRLPVLSSIGQQAPTSGLTLILVVMVMDHLTSEWAGTFDVSWHLTFCDIWNFVTYDISWHLTFH